MDLYLSKLGMGERIVVELEQENLLEQPESAQPKLLVPPCSLVAA